MTAQVTAPVIWLTPAGKEPAGICSSATFTPRFSISTPAVTSSSSVISSEIGISRISTSW